MNRIPRHFLSLLFFISLCVPVFASNEPSQLVVKLKDNTEKIFILADKPAITFDTEKVYINTSDFSAELGNVHEFYFKTETTTGIKAVNKGNAADASAPFTFRFVDGTTVYIDGLDNFTHVTVYSLSGAKANPRINISNGRAVVDLANQAAAVYIIKAGKQSYKIIKR